MADNPRVKQFPNYLLKVSLGNEIRWDPTPDKDTFRVQLPTGAWARISHTTGPIQTGPAPGELPMELPQYVLELLNEKGRVVREWTSHEDLPALFEAARNSALQPDETLDEVVESLKELLERSRREPAGKR